MKLRLMVEIDADPDTITALAEMTDYQARVDVDPHDGYKSMEGRLMGAVPVDQEQAMSGHSPVPKAMA